MALRSPLRQGRFKDIGSIHGTFTTTTCTHQGMDLINKKNDISL